MVIDIDIWEVDALLAKYFSGFDPKKDPAKRIKDKNKLQLRKYIDELTSSMQKESLKIKENTKHPKVFTDCMKEIFCLKIDEYFSKYILSELHEKLRMISGIISAMESFCINGRLRDIYTAKEEE